MCVCVCARARMQKQINACLLDERQKMLGPLAHPEVAPSFSNFLSFPEPGSQPTKAGTAGRSTFRPQEHQPRSAPGSDRHGTWETGAPNILRSWLPGAQEGGVQAGTSLS